MENESFFDESLARDNTLIHKRGRRRTPRIELAPRLWVEELKQKHGCQTSYQLKRLFEPACFRRNAAGDRFHHNKWRRYAAGKYPSQSLIEKVDSKSPGSARLLLHPLWTLLANEPGDAKGLSKLRSQLPTEILNIMANCWVKSAPLYSRNPQIKSAKLFMFERRAGLDSVTALAILVLESIKAGSGKSAFTLAETLFGTLLILCSTQPFCGFGNELLKLFEIRIFSMVEFNGVTFDFSDYDFEQRITLINKAYAYEKWKYYGSGNISLKNEIRLKMNLLSNGRRWYKFACAFLAPLKPCHPKNEENERKYFSCKQWNAAIDWGTNCVLNQEDLPPPKWISLAIEQTKSPYRAAEMTVEDFRDMWTKLSKLLTHT